MFEDGGDVNIVLNTAKPEVSVDSFLGRDSFYLVIHRLAHDCSVVDLGLIFHIIQPNQGVLHPLLVIAIWEVVAGMCATRFLSILCSGDCHFRL